MRRHIAPAVVVLLVGVFSASGVSGTAASGALTERVSVSSAGAEGNGPSVASIAVSGDGHFFAFTSFAFNLVPGDTNGRADAFVRDRVAGTTSRVSVSSAGGQGNGASGAAALSRDGRYVAFTSSASNLVPGDTNGLSDVFVRDRVAGTTSRVSTSSSGGQGNGGSAGGPVSGDGRYVAFISSASDLVPGDTNGKFDVFVRDRVAGTTSRVSVSSAGEQGRRVSFAPALSGDGRYVAFFSHAPNLVSGDTNRKFDVFVRDRVAGTTSRVSVGSSGGQANGDSFAPALSGDGRYVAFHSGASNLVPGTNGTAGVFVRDRVAGTTSLVSVSSTGRPGDNGASGFPAVSDDGRYVAFTSSASNLVPGDTNGDTDVFLRDRLAGTTSRVSVSSAGGQGNAESSFFGTALSGDGRFVVFASSASNLVPGDTNGTEDVFVRDRGAPVSGGDDVFAVLKGSEEVPGPGDPDGLGVAILHLHANQGVVCADVSLSKVDRPTAAHVHAGRPGVAGPIVIDLTPAVTGGRHCVRNVDAKLIRQIREHPGDYYVNVHTAAYPNGAVRGRLHT